MRKDIELKLGNMKKPQSFTVYPLNAEDGNRRTIQSDKRIALIDITTGNGILRKSSRNSQLPTKSPIWEIHQSYIRRLSMLHEQFADIIRKNGIKNTLDAMRRAVLIRMTGEVQNAPADKEQQTKDDWLQVWKLTHEASLDEATIRLSKQFPPEKTPSLGEAIRTIARTRKSNKPDTIVNDR